MSTWEGFAACSLPVAGASNLEGKCQTGLPVIRSEHGPRGYSLRNLVIATPGGWHCIAVLDLSCRVISMGVMRVLQGQAIHSLVLSGPSGYPCNSNTAGFVSLSTLPCIRHVAD